MGVVLALSLLITVVGCQSTKAEESVDNFDRIITICTEETMEIHLRKDYDQFFLKGVEPECTPVYKNETDYDGSVIRTKVWTLPIIKGDGPCGLKYLPVEDSDLWKHATTIYGPDKEREAHCIRVGVLDKRGAQILIETLTPELARVNPEGVESTVEIQRGSTLSAYFHYRFPAAASLSLHPINCWMINERRQTRRQVVDNGCPVAAAKSSVAIGSESASSVTGDLPHIFFNAEPALFPDENPSDLPSFRLQCTVVPCKGSDLFQQVIGVARCPSIAKCQDGKRVVNHPADIFEVNQDFSLTISDTPIPAKVHRDLRGPIYPGEYWFIDSKARATQRKEEADKLAGLQSEWPKALCFVLIGAAVAAALIIGALVLIRLRGKAISTYVRHRMASLNNEWRVSRNDNDPEKRSTALLVEEDYYSILSRNPDAQPNPAI